MSYTYDPEVEAFIPYAPPVDASKFDETRAMLAEFAKMMPNFEPDESLAYTVHEVPGLDGDPPIEAHVVGPAGGTTNAPVLLFFHGGGFVLGHALESMPFLAEVAAATGAVGVSVNYRLAPETPYPGPLNDGYAVYVWLRENADSLGIDPDRIAVGGQSAGGALAAGLALRVRDEGGGFSFMLLDIPVTDDRGLTDSATDYTDTLVWHRANAEAGWAHYLAGTTEPIPAYAAPARAETLAGLPPACVAVNQFDPLRDEGIEFARRLAHTGVPVELHLYPGTFHGSAPIAATAAVSQRQAADLLGAITRAFTAVPQEN